MVSDDIIYHILVKDAYWILFKFGIHSGNDKAAVG